MRIKRAKERKCIGVCVLHLQHDQDCISTAVILPCGLDCTIGGGLRGEDSVYLSSRTANWLSNCKCCTAP